MNPPGDCEAPKCGSLTAGLGNRELSCTSGGVVGWGEEEPGKVSMRACLFTDSLSMPNNRIPLVASR